MKNEFRYLLSLDNVDSYEATNTMYLEFQTWT